MSTLESDSDTGDADTVLLAVDASATASVALLHNTTVLAAQESASTTTHAEVLTPMMQHVLDAAELSHDQLTGIVVGVGPGPFTGLRAGIVTAQALGFAWNLPVYGVMSLDALAHRAAEDAWRIGAEEFVVATDARRKEVYWSHCSTVGGQFQRLHGPFVTAPEDVTPLPVYGAGAGRYPDVLHGVTGAEHWVPRAEEIGFVAQLAMRRGRGLEPVEPKYLRESDAKVPAGLSGGAQRAEQKGS